MDTQPPHKHLLLTVGATATFPALVHLLTKPALLTDLHRRGFTHIHVQTGPASSQSWLDVFLAEMQLAEAAYRMHIEVFPHKDSLCDDMVLCQACVDSRPPRTQGLILAHAGTGTVLDAWRVGVPIIIYPNPSLLDNHQDELAAEIERQDYGIRGNLECVCVCVCVCVHACMCVCVCV